jgi:hypothetical protein
LGSVERNLAKKSIPHLRQQIIWIREVKCQPFKTLIWKALDISLWYVYTSKSMPGVALES